MSGFPLIVRPLLTALCVALLALPAPAGFPSSPVVAEASDAFVFTTNTQVPLAAQVFVPCANAGLGEWVALSGTLHLQSTVVLTDNAVLLASVTNPQGVRGTGLTTGTRYQGTGVTRNSLNAAVGVAGLYVNNFRIVGQGPGNNYLVHATVRVTVQPDGALAVRVERFSVECR